MKNEFDEQTLEIYYYVRDFLKNQRFAPSLHQIAKGCFMAASTVTYRLSKLEAKGWLVREVGVARSLRLGSLAPDYVPEENAI